MVTANFRARAQELLNSNRWKDFKQDASVVIKSL